MTINESEYRLGTDATSTSAPTETALIVESEDRHENQQGSQSDATEQGATLGSVINAIVRASSLAEAVRFIGAGLIVFALSLFLMQGVDATHDLQRFQLLLLQTALLGAAGFAVGYLLKEPRGARVFFSLGLISIPANMAVLGAMIYSMLPAEQQAAHYPDYASWQASSTGELALAVTTGAFVLIPMTLFAFSVFARQSRNWLSAGYLLASTVLLIPVRDSFYISVMSGLVAFGLVLLLRRRRPTVQSQLTPEERFARFLLFLPPGLMMARSVMLYSSEFNTLVMASLVVYLVLRYSSSQARSATWINTAIHLFTALAAIGLAGLLSSLMAINNVFSGPNLLFPMILGALFLDLSRLTPSARLRWWMNAGWALLCLPAFLANFVFPTGLGPIAFTLTICILMIVSGTFFRSRFVVVLGVLAFMANLAVQGGYMIHLVLSSNWITLACLGASVVVAGSVIERFGVVGKLKIQAWWRKAAPECINDVPESLSAKTGVEQATEKGLRNLAA